MATQLALSIWHLFWGDSMGVCLQATVAFVVRVAWPQWSASLRSASIPATATQEPPSLHNHQRHCLFYTFPKAKCASRNTQQHLQYDRRDHTDARCYFSPPALSASLSQDKFIFKRRTGDKAGAAIEIQHRLGGGRIKGYSPQKNQD